MTCDIPSLFLCLNRLPKKVPFLPVSVTGHLLFFALFRLGFLCESVGQALCCAPGPPLPGRPCLPWSLSSELGLGPVTKDAGHPIGCVCRNSSPYTWLTALFTVYKLLTWGPLWASWNSVWHSVLPVWEEWVPSCSSKGWDPKNIGKK